jgi:hypothetical protein
MALFLLIAFLVTITLAVLKPAAHRDAQSPVHPSLRHLTNDPEISRDWRIS